MVQSELGTAAYSAAYSAAAAATSPAARRAGPDADAASDALSAPALWALLSRPRCHLYIAGAANQMPKDVRWAVRRLATEHGGCDEEGAEAFVRQLEVQKRLQCETW